MVDIVSMANRECSAEIDAWARGAAVLSRAEIARCRFVIWQIACGLLSDDLPVVEVSTSRE